MSGRKDDAGKPRWGLLPLHELDGVVRVLTYGANRYGDNNWRLVENGVDRYYDACLRHLSAFTAGQDIDQESGLSHLDHAICNLIFVRTLLKGNGE